MYNMYIPNHAYYIISCKILLTVIKKYVNHSIYFVLQFRQLNVQNIISVIEGNDASMHVDNTAICVMKLYNIAVMVVFGYVPEIILLFVAKIKQLCNPRLITYIL